MATCEPPRTKTRWHSADECRLAESQRLLPRWRPTLAGRMGGRDLLDLAASGRRRFASAPRLPGSQADVGRDRRAASPSQIFGVDFLWFRRPQIVAHHVVPNLRPMAYGSPVSAAVMEAAEHPRVDRFGGCLGQRLELPNDGLRR